MWEAHSVRRFFLSPPPLSHYVRNQSVQPAGLFATRLSSVRCAQIFSRRSGFCMSIKCMVIAGVAQAVHPSFQRLPPLTQGGGCGTGEEGKDKRRLRTECGRGTPCRDDNGGISRKGKESPQRSAPPTLKSGSLLHLT
jgi:hypothetical protein